MTRKDYQLIARALRAVRPMFNDKEKHIQWSMCVEMLAIELLQENPRFDKHIFRKACEE